MHRIASTEPEWLELIPAADDKPALRGLFAPIDRAAAKAAQRALRAALAEDPTAVEAASEAMSEELIRLGLRDWDGLGDAKSKDKPIPFTPENLARFLADPILFAAADEVYAAPYKARVAEKNGYSPSRTGTSGARTAAKRTAAAAATPAKSARTRSTRRKP